MNVANQIRATFSPDIRRSFSGKSVFLAPMGRKHLCMEGEPGGGGGGSANPPAIPEDLKPVVNKMIADAVQEQVNGLKGKNSELLGKLREANDTLKNFEGIDPGAMKALLARFDDDEERGLLKEGKFEDVVKKRTERMQAAHQKELQKLQQQMDSQRQVNQKLSERAVSDAIMRAASKAGALPEAIDDIVLRAKGAGWSVNPETGEVVAKNGDEIVLGNDGKTPLTPVEWAESLRESATHLWPRAQGSNAPGNGATTKGGVDLSKLPPVERLAKARELGMVPVQGTGMQQQANGAQR